MLRWGNSQPLTSLPDELVDSIHHLLHLEGLTDLSYLEEIFEDFDINTYSYGTNSLPYVSDCILAGNIDALRLGVCLGVDIDQANQYNRKALYWSCLEHHYDITAYLLTLGFHHLTEMEKVQIFQKCDYELFALLIEHGISFQELLSNAHYLYYDNVKTFTQDRRKLCYLLQVSQATVGEFHRILDLQQKLNPLMLLIHRYGQLREVDVTLLTHLLDLIHAYIDCFHFDFNYIPPGRTDEYSTLTFFLSTIRPCFNNAAHHQLVRKIVDVMVKKGGACPVMAERFLPINRALPCRCQACVFASVIPSRCVRFPLNIR